MRVLSPTSLADACAMMATDNSAAPTPIAGGTDLLVHWPGNLAAHDKTYLDLSHLAELHVTRWTDTHLELGALATYWDTIRDAAITQHFPLLISAARTVGAIQIQSRGTWAGNIINASPAADGVPALMALDASIVLVSTHTPGMSESSSESRGYPNESQFAAASLHRQEIRLDEFYLGYKQMRKRSDQLIEKIRIPRRPARLHIFEKVGARRAQAITKVGAAIIHTEETGWRIVAHSVAPTVRRCRAVESLLESNQPIKSPLDLAPALNQDISPIDDIRSTAAYRERVLARILYFALRGVATGVS